ncbi:ATP-dependent helicase [Cereibacter sphaeroides]|uniref:ATP-dependent helicase n=1 Tax=Cereibacter sphaeroides TaxID=1063 RepID=UPI001F3F312E|nr:ATP-dependent helicase [Cereibacter sphaeroides]MCE6959665.1 ATP-dependent helicase [Cereibacter sphaeroides]MCE6974474.1 ATP-dependent helicase [Cereibacter sphaeroides]
MSEAKTFIESLSGEQRAAALKTDNPVMIIAGAGSGKTRTLVGRFIHLVTPVSMGGLGADPSSIMMVTFTNKAGREMRERIVPVLEDLRRADDRMPKGEPWIGTFHGISLRILRVEAQRAGLGANFSIFDESDARSLATEVADQMDLEQFDVDTFFKDLEIAKARLLGADLLSAKAQQLLQCEIAGVQPDPVLKRWGDVLKTFETPDFVPLYAAYQRALTEQNAVDFSDLMNRVTTLFREHEDIRNSWRSTFRHFMVDEVQDINRAQVAWLDALTAGGAVMEIPEDAEENQHADASLGMHEINTFRVRKFPRPTVAFVGDDDQSIYGFRGSEVAVMRGLDRRYPGLDLKFLRASYRCQPSILSVANELVSNNTGRYGKELEPADPMRVSARVTIEEHMTPQLEIRRIAADAARHIAAGKDASQFAVLVRTRDLVKAVARELRASGLPVSEGKASDIRKSAEVRDAMAYAGFLTNSDAETFLRRIINKPARGLGPTSTARVGRNARLKNVSFIEELRSIMNGRIDLPQDAEPYTKAFIEHAKDFGRLVVALRTEIGGAADAGAALLAILDRTGYLPALKEEALKSAGLHGTPEMMALPPAAFLQELIRDAAKGSKSARRDSGREEEMSSEDLVDRAGQLSETARRIGNLSLLLEQAAKHPSLDAFMQEATLEMDQSEAQAGIQVMTIHGSKGLEFDRVTLPFWIDGIMPHARAETEGPEALEEERRLAYVAITRARHELRISRSWNIRKCPFIRLRDSTPSRFLGEIRQAPREDVQFLTIKSESHPVYDPSRPEPAPPSAAPKPHRQSWIPRGMGAGMLRPEGTAFGNALSRGAETPAAAARAPEPAEPAEASRDVPRRTATPEPECPF